MRAYIGTKIVRAGEIIEIRYETGAGAHLVLDGARKAVEVSDGYLRKHQPQVGGYYVLYSEDGYESYSPPSAFVAAYRPVSVNEERAIKDAIFR